MRSQFQMCVNVGVFIIEKKKYIIFNEALLLMENNHNFQKENSENFHMICVRILPILKIQTSADMNLCLCHPHFHRARG